MRSLVYNFGFYRVPAAARSFPGKTSFCFARRIFQESRAAVVKMHFALCVCVCVCVRAAHFIISRFSAGKTVLKTLKTFIWYDGVRSDPDGDFAIINHQVESSLVFLFLFGQRRLSTYDGR